MLDRYRVNISKEAMGDLTRIYDYIEARSPQNAALVLERLFNAIDSLEVLPHRYEIVEAENDFDEIVHSMAHPPFILYYSVMDAEKVVQIISVRHGAQIQPRWFD